MSLPPRISQWWVYFQDAARARGVPAILLAAICDRETLGGTSSSLDIPGPCGTGDRAPRRGTHYGRSNRYRPVAMSDGTGWMPEDGLGWGRGLMQLDFEFHPEAMVVDYWTSPAKNIDKGAEILASSIASFVDDVAKEALGVAAYNAGPHAIRKRVEALTQPATYGAKIAAADSVTAGGNYVSDVFRRRDQFLKPDALELA